ncbi:DUF2911 domain-containing protein [Arcticibacterium luteifluviistationis]|uniref:DUF2911 domain-containing protein n=1 Tax=Arcticibacterium luteifluviistationis TaxID=1784714 RepID=A0A2Z4GE19_9BACT|nr:DUF2911 domain-containing protein [Arcticibacterium luteifluviistationis]AWV99559.1 hypothetical protein DJ013_15840 [Arcticibacterium luteifluviistationis]
MKKLLFLAAALLFVGTSSSFAQKSPKMTSSEGNISVTYSAPSVKGRDIFGGLVPYNEVWRTGANNATEITFAKDGSIGGKAVKAGTYSLFTIPKADGDWTVILNPTLKQWGSFKYGEIKDADLPHVMAKTSKTASNVEQMKISVEGGNLVIAWADTKASVAVK